ncbi:Hypothetical protein DPCES_0436 [Desulfitobacterium hafniense]|uniref:Uncharacterized protein n=1 Tax=Desulfitobacterium hafniense TaxID=49338 RepID=A0A098AUW6_DESHA|nr:hypothetical protein [Desulfitobacterium hafniense]CDX00323.1 Hypothetical protein DPCES_0436 [Desulfitobacterium hafniense]
MVEVMNPGPCVVLFIKTVSEVRQNRAGNSFLLGQNKVPKNKIEFSLNKKRVFPDILYISVDG